MKMKQQQQQQQRRTPSPSLLLLLLTWCACCSVVAISFTLTSAGTAAPRALAGRIGSVSGSRRLCTRRQQVALGVEETSSGSTAAALDAEIADIRARVNCAPDPLDEDAVAKSYAEAPATAAERFLLDAHGGIAGGEEEEQRLAEALRRQHVVIVRVVAEEDRSSLLRMSASAEGLLCNPTAGPEGVEQRQERFGYMRDMHDGASEGSTAFSVVGYAGGGDFGQDEFLEIRERGDGSMEPLNDAGSAAEADLKAGRSVLSSIAEGVLRAIARSELSMCEDSLLSLVDGGAGPENEFQVSATPLRVCKYAGADREAFGAHTDTTFLTLIPCAKVPGLEILQPQTGAWLRPEAASDIEAGTDVSVLTGDFLQVLCKGRYPSAVHRVVRSAGANVERISTPLLVRGSPETFVPRGAFGGAAGEGFTLGRLWGEKLQRLQEKNDDDGDDVIIADSHGPNDVFAFFERFAPNGLEVLSEDPLLVRLKGFTSSEKCEGIMSAAESQLLEATTWTEQDNQAEQDATTRISSTTWMGDDDLPILRDMTARACALSGIDAGNMENWQVARYQKGGFFRLHEDNSDDFNSLPCGGRLGTLLVYLNDSFEGGETDFPQLGVRVAPVAGDAIYFNSVHMPIRAGWADKMRTNERSCHAGLPVESGHKWIATKVRPPAAPALPCPKCPLILLFRISLSGFTQCLILPDMRHE
jgi:prolyl 4-hydroxylase